MKRPQRNLLIILSALAVAWLGVRELPLTLALGFAGAVFLLGLALMVWGRDFLIGRYRTRRREWQLALERYRRFEQKLLSHRWSSLLTPLYLSIYSFDGVAIGRNNIAHSLMHLGELDEAVRWLRSALQRDPLYPIPYTNLATVAAMRKDLATAESHLRRAVELGYSPTGAQLLLRRLLALANESAGHMLK